MAGIKYIMLRILGSLSAPCGIYDGPGGSNGQSNGGGGQPTYSIVVDSASELPDCSDDVQNQLAYVEPNQSFALDGVYCDRSKRKLPPTASTKEDGWSFGGGTPGDSGGPLILYDTGGIAGVTSGDGGQNQDQSLVRNIYVKSTLRVTFDSCATWLGMVMRGFAGSDSHFSVRNLRDWSPSLTNEGWLNFVGRVAVADPFPAKCPLRGGAVLGAERQTPCSRASRLMGLSPSSA